ncbi:unnamed protein product [Protopolystoma xenopodis]|uniref:Uncharacterized protein n=1 Tax=Protopolystoma xenopodis TaxID=117903 RepID=A0A3S5A308_9PLAT|nr:unnamed protein product [Protopolystoma xenopodis]
MSEQVSANGQSKASLLNNLKPVASYTATREMAKKMQPPSPLPATNTTGTGFLTSAGPDSETTVCGNADGARMQISHSSHILPTVNAKQFELQPQLTTLKDVQMKQKTNVPALVVSGEEMNREKGLNSAINLRASPPASQSHQQQQQQKTMFSNEFRDAETSEETQKQLVILMNTHTYLLWVKVI